MDGEDGAAAVEAVKYSTLSPFLASAALFLVVVLGALFSVALNPLLASWLFSLLDVAGSFPELGHQEVATKGLEVILYLLFWSPRLPPEFFSPRGIAHMVDVRFLFLLGYVVFVCCLGVLGFSSFAARNNGTLPVFCSTVLRCAGMVGVGFVVVLVTVALVAWEWSFVVFHEIFFRNDLWLLPSDDSLILLYPPEFFQSIVAIWCSLVLGISLVMLGLGYRMQPR